MQQVTSAELSAVQVDELGGRTLVTVKPHPEGILFMTHLLRGLKVDGWKVLRVFIPDNAFSGWIVVCRADDQPDAEDVIRLLNALKGAGVYVGN